MSSKYLKYAVGEIILVVIGILIALSINNWNELRKNRIKEEIYLKRLNTELQVIFTRLANGVQLAKESSQSAELLIEYYLNQNRTEVEVDDLKNAVRQLRAGRVPAGSPAAFKEMISSGELTIISNEALRNTLFKYDEFSVIARDVWRGGWQEFLQGYPTVVSIIQGKANFGAPLNEAYVVDDFNLKAFLSNKEMSGALNIILASKVNQYELLTMQLNLAQEIDSLLNIELEDLN